MGRHADADRPEDFAPFPFDRSSGTLSDAMETEFDPVFRRTLAHRENGPGVNAGTVISYRREIRVF